MGMVNFVKMNGIGNKILVVDMRDCNTTIAPDVVSSLSSDERTQFDQMMVVYRSNTLSADAKIFILNRDGSEVGACGNGTRCVVDFLAKETGQKTFTFETLRGLLNAEQHMDGLISVDMCVPLLDWKDVPLARKFDDTSCIDFQVGSIDSGFILDSPSVLSMGNPHIIFWIEKNFSDYDLSNIGKHVENDPMFTEGINVSLAKITSKSSLQLCTWERGVGLTLACGSAACAAAVSSIRIGRTDRTVLVEMPGGKLMIHWRDDGHVIMTGPAEKEWAGKLDSKTGAWIKTHSFI
ncbi:Diaminopimelate epimerase [Liberibacter crescens BT-1]|uniref:Diaminopimelate epimerase n=1 Tax=Liberibacter crescens (strain BT-1) TaxID=1215343 RepID=L0EUM8_LIBCB|nr:diaminopimelate epimerase [Liberibacter crescens]AGA65259.1 Diaminopimelate epimerase [Liberibacter crescens BT-1]AMC13195.1 diaminopimelate epimerase [Liberibacter crescens]